MTVSSSHLAPSDSHAQPVPPQVSQIQSGRFSQTLPARQPAITIQNITHFYPSGRFSKQTINAEVTIKTVKVGPHITYTKISTTIAITTQTNSKKK